MPAVYSGRSVSDCRAILERVHLFDTTSVVSPTAGEQLGELEVERGDLAIAVQPRGLAGGVDDVREATVVVGEKVVRAAHGLHLAHTTTFLGAALALVLLDCALAAGLANLAGAAWAGAKAGASSNAGQTISVAIPTKKGDPS